MATSPDVSDLLKAFDQYHQASFHDLTVDDNQGRVSAELGEHPFAPHDWRKEATGENQKNQIDTLRSCFTTNGDGDAFQTELAYHSAVGMLVLSAVGFLKPNSFRSQMGHENVDITVSLAVRAPPPFQLLSLV